MRRVSFSWVSYRVPGCARVLPRKACKLLVIAPNGTIERSRDVFEGIGLNARACRGAPPAAFEAAFETHSCPLARRLNTTVGKQGF